MEIVPLKTIHGEDKAWACLSEMPSGQVCRNADVRYDAAAATYTVTSFGIDFLVSTAAREISSTSPRAPLFLERLGDFFRLSLLWYLTSAKDIPSSNRLVRPLDVRGGHRFFSGTHTLPLDRLAAKYGRDRSGFQERGKMLGGESAAFGDAAIRLSPLPRVPTYVILWLEDEEFPARVDLLFDSTCDLQLSLSDILWSVAMLSCLSMLD